MAESGLPKAWFNEKEAAEYMGFHPVTLRRWRMQGKGPIYAKMRNGAIRYCKEWLDLFVREFTVQPGLKFPVDISQSAPHSRT